jgi:hypothetical protein
MNRIDPISVYRKDDPVDVAHMLCMVDEPASTGLVTALLDVIAGLRLRLGELDVARPQKAKTRQAEKSPYERAIEQAIARDYQKAVKLWSIRR